MIIEKVCPQSLDSSMGDRCYTYLWDYIPVGVLGSKPVLEWCERGVECIKNNESVIVNNLPNSPSFAWFVLIGIAIVFIIGLGFAGWYYVKADDDFIHS